jgi:tetratricopeptide (TPR) repeat protein
MAGPSYRLAELKLPPLLKPPPLPAQETGVARLRTLVERRAWGDVLQVSGDMLRSASNPHAAIYASLVNNQDPEEATSAEEIVLQQEMIEILTLECHAWLKLRRYVDLAREVERWSFCRINDITAVHPTWVPWSLQILAAESLQYTDAASVQRCVDELYGLRDIVQDEDAKYVLTIDSALSNVFLRQKDWRMALESLDHMLQMLPQIHSGDTLHGHQVEVLSRQGRILLQVGAIAEAEQMFEKIMPPLAVTQRSWAVDKIPIQLALHQGMIYFARKDYIGSMTSFKQSSDLLRNHPDPIHRYQKDAYVGSSVWVESPQSLLTQAWNNMGLSALYTCRMKEAVRLMESLVREDPTAYLTERLAFNLCTLYELGADTATSARKKRVLQLVAKRFYLHDIGPEQFRVS